MIQKETTSNVGRHEKKLWTDTKGVGEKESNGNEGFQTKGDKADKHPNPLPTFFMYLGLDKSQSTGRNWLSAPEKKICWSNAHFLAGSTGNLLWVDGLAGRRRPA